MLFAEEAERVPPFIVDGILGGPERRKYQRSEFAQALDRFEPEG
jgi:hypothetical protein